MFDGIGITPPSSSAQLNAFIKAMQEKDERLHFALVLALSAMSCLKTKIPRDVWERRLGESYLDNLDNCIDTLEKTIDMIAAAKEDTNG